MIYLFAGDDAKNKLLAYEKFLKSIPSGTETFFINRNDFNKTQIESLYSGSGLFFSKCAVIFENILEYEENRDFILEKLKPMSKSPNSFVFLESKLNKMILDIFKKTRAELNIFILPKAQTEKFNNFLVANAFGQKDKLNLWIYFRQAVDRGVGMEELIGVLFWKVKDMLIKKDFRKFSEAELKSSASRLSFLLPEARKAGLDAEAAFEQFLLEAF
ncbi:hypothetical protein A3A05_02220 [Candidatus Nomurabacteria bacterium RIFCSPLOWO2_01_FULL_41_12]|uniref:DNA polymerase III delta N-terminal domain-containing protein n=1 Tax=Candidatus Nomurabacteria bacterium RIFCSPLOWO2_01_FULL_41_12 TaxID=1801774 RepID=A0A1F6WUJ1_9BACT|nr:MAG: hypothetical protein A2732_02140 [Candidatus Nomurabacteria bacterium RIFCSPHIGHO2_01_FULL_40_10]OGI85529.1 MAG: hypothetical protein A3A05_02220 [Candidatus Nomurabacteria bacterium RIFCSPLOWO2_01_FULL_41_12]